MDVSERQAALQRLAESISRRRLSMPARILLDVIEPLGFLASQVMLFMHPFTPFQRWRMYVSALEDEQSWKVLQKLVDQRDS